MLPAPPPFDRRQAVHGPHADNPTGDCVGGGHRNTSQRTADDRGGSCPFRTEATHPNQLGKSFLNMTALHILERNSLSANGTQMRSKWFQNKLFSPPTTHSTISVIAMKISQTVINIIRMQNQDTMGDRRP